MIELASLTKLAEGKTKVIYSNPEYSSTVYMVFKDDITAGDGVKHDVLEGKAKLDWEMNRDIFELLNRAQIPTHYITSPEERIALVKKLDRKINLEVVSRCVAAGSIVKWAELEEGTRLDPPLTQFHYKDDPIHDPMLDNSYIEYLIEAKGTTEYAAMRGINEDVLLLLERAFAASGMQLLDLKLEYGIVDGRVLVIDEISAGSLRLWPYRTKTPTSANTIFWMSSIRAGSSIRILTDQAIRWTLSCVDLNPSRRLLPTSRICRCKLSCVV